MELSRDLRKNALGTLLTLLVALIIYRVLGADKPRTAPLTYLPGAVATSQIRRGAVSSPAGSDPVLVFLEKREERFPGMMRDLFRMENPSHRPKALTQPLVPLGPPAPPQPSEPVKTPEESAAELSRADLSKFRFLGYLTDKDSSLFLSKDGELYIVRKDDTILKTYKVKEANKDYVVLIDTLTRVEVRVELSGGAEQTPAQHKVR